MKFLHLIVLSVLFATALTQTWIGIGQRVPGETLLGFSQNSTTYTQTPQNHTLQLFYHGTPGNNITYVHVNMDPGFSSLRYPVLGQFYDFWVDIYRTNTTFLSANMYVYGFLPTFAEKQFIAESPETPQMVTINGDSN